MAAGSIKNLAELNAVIEQCGCCPAPRCCPPIIECKSAVAGAEHVGFVDDSGSASTVDRSVLYLRREGRTTVPGRTVTSHHEDYGDWVSEEFSSDAYEGTFGEYSGSMRIHLGDCISLNPTLTEGCVFGGSDTLTFYALVYEGDAWIRYRNSESVHVYESAAGEIRPDWTAWEAEAATWDAAHPDYETEHATWQTAYDAHQAWSIARDAWVNEDPENRVPEDYPEPDPGDPGAEPPPRPIAPEKFFGSCDCKVTITETWWKRQDGGTVLVDPSELGGGITTNPYVHVEYDTLSALSTVIRSFVGTSFYSVTFSSPVTYTAFLADAEAWVGANVHLVLGDDALASSSSSSSCAPTALCYAMRSEGNGSYAEVAFRFRIKLNKCCGYKTVLSRWLEVFYPQVWLDWEAAVLRGDSAAGAEPADVPVPEVQAWSWTGIPPLCGGSSSSSSSSAPLDPYDDPSMWSPFSRTIRVPLGRYGEIMNRNYQQKCYDSGSLWDDMPEVFGTFDASSSSSAP